MAKELRRFFRDRPQAADTVDGITKWWLVRQRYEEARETVRQALEHLVEQRELRKVETPCGVVIYKRQAANGEE